MKYFEEFGYKAVALGYFYDDLQAVYTSNFACSISLSVVD